MLIRMWENVVLIRPHFLGLLICGLPLFVPKQMGKNDIRDHV